MLGHRVRVIRDGASSISGVLQSLKPEGVVVSPEGMMPEQSDNVFVPMARVLEIQDRGPVYL